MCLPSQLPIHTAGLRANVPARRASRPADLGLLRFKLSSNSGPCSRRKKKQISCNQSHLSIELFLSDLPPLRRKKLEALISLDTGVWGFLFALAAFLAYQSPPCLLSAFSARPPPQSSFPPKTVTVAAANGVINTRVQTTRCHLELSASFHANIVI